MTRTNIHFGVENKKAQLFLIWVIFWISIWKLSYVLHGKIVVVWKMISDCPNQPNLPRELKTRIAFSMFPILDTNLWLYPFCKGRYLGERKKWDFFFTSQVGQCTTLKSVTFCILHINHIRLIISGINANFACQL